SRRDLPLLLQQLLQHPNPLIHMLLLQQKRRQKPHHRILRRIKKNALLQSRIHNRPRRNLQIDPLNKSAPPHFPRRRTFFSNRFQFLLQVRANFIHVVQQPLLFHNRQKLQRYPASQGTATKSRPMLPRRNRIGKLLLGEKSPQRQPRRNRLGNRHHVGSHAKTLKRKHPPRTPQPALNLIKNQRRLVLVRRRAAR